MAFRIEEDERLPEGIRRLACEQIDHARSLLTLPIADRDGAIHNVRKCFKKLRGILRLVRDEVGEEVYEFENKFFRDLGRRLSAQRDFMSVIGATEKLLKASEGHPAALLVGPIHDKLKSEHDERGNRNSDLDDVMAEVRGELSDAFDRAAQWPVERNRFAAIDRGLKRTYKMGRRAFSEATADPTMENLHEWRKQVKYLWYCARILESMWPEVFDAMTHELHAVADDLGDDHDLAMLRTLLKERQELAGSDDDRALILALIDEHRSAFQESAKSRGARIYSERAKPFIKRMRTYWKAWHLDEVV